MFATGNDYSRGCNRFIENAARPSVFERNSNFKTEAKGDSLYTSIFRVTLQPVRDGTARTRELDDSDIDF